LKKELGNDNNDFTIDIVVTDPLAHTAEGQVLIEVIGVNHQPRFPDCNNYTASIKENEPIGTIVLQVSLLFFSFCTLVFNFVLLLVC
jgi:hypothetical protein